MFNGYNETPLISHSEFHLEREKKQENASKWSYGQDVQPSQNLFSNRPSELWCGKPNFIEIPNVANISPKCNCSGCYSSSESYQSDSTRVRSWLPKSFPVPINNSKDSSKLPEHHQWNNVGLPNPSSCYSESSVQPPQYVQEAGGRHPYYRHFSNARFSESNQPGVITTAKKSEFAKEDVLSKQKGDDEGLKRAGQELTFHDQNGIRQSVFCSAGYNLTKNFDKRMESQSSNFRDSNERFSNLDSFRCSVSSSASTIDQSRLSVVEPYVKTVPSDNNQNRVPSSGHRNIKENMPQSNIYQSYDSRKNMCSEPCSVFGVEKNARTMYQSRLGKEGMDNFHMEQHVHNMLSPVTIEPKNSDIHANSRMYNNNREIAPSRGCLPEAEGQNLLENRRSEFFPRNNFSEEINKNNQPSLADIRKDCVINSIGQINFSDLRYSDLSRSSGTLENHKLQSEMFYPKDYNTEKVYRQEKMSRLQDNPSFFQKSDNLVQNKNLNLHNRLPPSSLICNDLRDSCLGERTQPSFPCPANLTDYRNYIRPEYSYQGYNSQDRYENPTATHMLSGLQRNEFNSYHHRNPQQQQQQQPPVSNFGGLDRQFTPQINASFVFNPHFQQLGQSERIASQQYHSSKNSSCDVVQMDLSVPQSRSENFLSDSSEVKKNSFLESVRSEDVNKKISPLRLLRKKKFVPQVNDNTTGPLAYVSTSDTAPVLDVRKFWSTWAEEEEENIGPTQMVVLDCQNIDPEQAKLLHFYESSTIRDVHLENDSSTGRGLNCIESNTVTIETSVQEAQTSNESSGEAKFEHDINKNIFENSQITQTDENIRKEGLVESKTNKSENTNSSISAKEKNNQVELKNDSLGNQSMTGDETPKKIFNDLTSHKIDTKLSKRVRPNVFHVNKETAKNKKINLEKKSDNSLDKWTEKKLGFLKRAEESKAAEILRHEEEKKKIFERRLSLQKGNAHDGTKGVKKNSPKPNNDPGDDHDVETRLENTYSEEKKEAVNVIPERLSPFDENFNSESPDCESASLSSLPTSEYRRNKFLDYSEQKPLFSNVTNNEKCDQSLEKIERCSEGVNSDLQPSDKSSLSETEENIASEYDNNSNKLPSEKPFSDEVQSLDFVIENSKKNHDTYPEENFENMTGDSSESESKQEIGHKMRVVSQSKKTGRSKKPKHEEESDESADKVTLENISTSKPTIKFSIQKSHDLKISFKVLNGTNKKYENLENEEKITKNEIDREESSVENTGNPTECITLKLKSFKRDGSNHSRSRKLSKKKPFSRDLDLIKKYKRRMKRKRLRGEMLEIKRTSEEEEEEEEKDPLAYDTDYKNCMKLSKNSHSDDRSISDNFQVQEKIDSAKIKLTFKRHKLNNEKYKNDELQPRKSAMEESKPEFCELFNEGSHPEFKFEKKPEIYLEPYTMPVKLEPGICEADIIADSSSKYVLKDSDLNKPVEEDRRRFYASMEPYPVKTIDDFSHEKLTDGNKSLCELSPNPKLSVSASKIHLGICEKFEEGKHLKEKFNCNEEKNSVDQVSSMKFNKPSSEHEESVEPAKEVCDHEEQVEFVQDGVCENEFAEKEGFLITRDEGSPQPEPPKKDCFEGETPVTPNCNFIDNGINESSEPETEESFKQEILGKSNSESLVNCNKDNSLSDSLVEQSFQEEVPTKLNPDGDQSYDNVLLDCNENLSTKEKNFFGTEKENCMKGENKKGTSTPEIEFDIDVFSCEKQKDDNIKNSIDSDKSSEDCDFDSSQTNCTQNTNENSCMPKSDDNHIAMMETHSEKISKISFSSTSQKLNLDLNDETTIVSEKNWDDDASSGNNTLISQTKPMETKVTTENVSERLVSSPQNQINAVVETLNAPVFLEEVKGQNECIGNSESKENESQSLILETVGRPSDVSSEEDTRKSTTHQLSPENTQYKVDEQTATVDKLDSLKLSSTSSSGFLNEIFNNHDNIKSTISSCETSIECEKHGKVDEIEDGELLSSPGSTAEDNLSKNITDDSEVNVKDNKNYEACVETVNELSQSNSILQTEKYLENCERTNKPFVSSFRHDINESSVSTNYSPKENDLEKALGLNKSLILEFDSSSIFLFKKSTFTNSTKISRRLSFEAAALKKQKFNEFEETNLKKVTTQNGFTYCKWKSRYKKAQSCPPSINFVNKTNMINPVLGIPVEDIPLPPGDPPAENCFDLRNYFKLQKMKGTTKAAVPEKAPDLKINKNDEEKESGCLPKTKSITRVNSLVKNCHSQQSLSHVKSSPLQTEKTQGFNEISPLPEGKNKFKVKFSLTKPKNFKTVLSETVSKNINRLKNRPQSLKLHDNLDRQTTVSLKNLNSNIPTKAESLNTSVESDFCVKNFDIKPKIDDIKTSTSLSLGVLATEEDETESTCETARFQSATSDHTNINKQKETEIEETKCHSPANASPANESTSEADESIQNLMENENVNSKNIKDMEIVQDESDLINFPEQGDFIKEEFYKCEDIPTSEDLPNDIEVQKVSDDDKFRNIMQNCLDNAKKFLNVGNLKLFSCSVDDLLELDCQLPEPMTDESEPEKSISVSANHISRDVLLTSCEETTTDDLGLSEKYLSEDMPMDFVPSFCSENSHNLCPEILPVENWPYLEEEVPSSPTKLKSEEADLTPTLEGLSGLETTKRKSLSLSNIRKTVENFGWDKANEMLFSDNKKFKRFRRRSFMSDGETFRKCSVLNLERRKTTDVSTGCYSISKKSLEKICGLKDSVSDIGNNRILQSFKCRLSLDKLSDNNCGNKIISNCSFLHKNGRNTFSEAVRSKLVHRPGLNYSSSVKSTEPTSCKKRKVYNYKSPVWQPKVVLFRISKQEVKRIRRSSHSRSCNKPHCSDKGVEITLENKKNFEDFNANETNLETKLKNVKLHSDRRFKNTSENFKIRESGSDQKPNVHADSLNAETELSHIDYKNSSVKDASVPTGFPENSQETIHELINPGASKVCEIKKRKKRFRNLYSKEKPDYKVNNSTKDLNFSAQKTSFENRRYEEPVSTEVLEGVDLSKERDFNLKNKSTKELTDKCKGSEEKSVGNTSGRIKTLSSSMTKKAKTSDVSVSDRSTSSCVCDKKNVLSAEISRGSLHQSKSEKHRNSLSGSYEEEKESSNSKNRYRDRRKEENEAKVHSRHKSSFSEKEVPRNDDRNGSDRKKSSVKKRLEENNRYENSKGSGSSDKRDSKVEELKSRERSPECPWVCEVCGFCDSTKRIPHIKSHPFHCQSCHLAFKTESRFVSHLTRKHKDIRNQHHCLLCELSFDTEDQYQRHLETREHRHLESVEKNTINTLFTLLTGEPCPVLGLVEMKPEWLPNQAGTVHFYHQATPLSLALQYLKMHHDLTSFPSVSSSGNTT